VSERCGRPGGIDQKAEKLIFYTKNFDFLPPTDFDLWSQLKGNLLQNFDLFTFLFFR